MRLGILGGAFDPIHYAHLRVAEEARESISLEKVLFIPTAVPPHKADRLLTPFTDRLKMVELAIEHVPHFAVSDIESIMPGRSYSVETLRRLRELYNRETEFYFIIGLDAFSELPTWREYKSLPSYAHLVVVHRPGRSHDELRAIMDQHFSGYSCNPLREEYLLEGQHSILYLSTTNLDISSTYIRNAIQDRRSVRFLLPPDVEEYIYRNGLYGKPNKS